MYDTFPDLNIVAHDDHYRSTGDIAIHSKKYEGDNYLKGKDALINCLLLSRCDIVIRTTSFLSAWAYIFNPKLELILLNKPYDSCLWFPERDLISRSKNEYLTID